MKLFCFFSLSLSPVEIHELPLSLFPRNSYLPKISAETRSDTHVTDGCTVGAGGPRPADAVGIGVVPLRSMAHLPRDHRRENPLLHHRRCLWLLPVTLSISLIHGNYSIWGWIGVLRHQFWNGVLLFCQFDASFDGIGVLYEVGFFNFFYLSYCDVFYGLEEHW